jgi:hypothetical protein
MDCAFLLACASLLLVVKSIEYKRLLLDEERVSTHDGFRAGRQTRRAVHSLSGALSNICI